MGYDFQSGRRSSPQQSAENSGGGEKVNDKGRALGSMQFWLISWLLVIVVWLALGMWFWSSSAIFRIAVYVLGDGRAQLQGASGNIRHGFAFSQLSIPSDLRNVEISGFHLRYDDLHKMLLQRKIHVTSFAIDLLKIDEIRLERPSARILREALNHALAMSQGISLNQQGPISEFRIDQIDIGQIQYRAAIGVPMITVGPVIVRNFVLSKGGWHADLAEVNGQQIHARVDKNGHDIWLDVRLDQHIFAPSLPEKMPEKTPPETTTQFVFSNNGLGG